ncbi:MAG: T9SS type A sorting domain-containing protein [Bergeyella sp.]
MKRILFFILFTGFMSVFSSLNAQTLREPASSSQKSDDGVIVAYPNPAKDFIIVKSKDASLKIKSVAFYTILGMQVSEMNVNMNSAEIKLDRLKPGKYLMRYTLSDNTQKVTQIIKQ